MGGAEGGDVLWVMKERKDEKKKAKEAKKRQRSERQEIMSDHTMTEEEGWQYR